MGEFSETSMPEPEISTDIPDSEPVADIVEDTPPEAEPTPEIVEEFTVDLSSILETAVDLSFDNEDTGEEAVEDVVDEASVEAESNMDTNFGPGLATESVDDIVPESDLDEEPFEAPQEIPQELDITPDSSGVDFYDAGSAEPVFPDVERTELYHSPETTREIEPGTGPNPSWDRPPDSTLNDQYPGEPIGEDGWSLDEGKVSSEDLEPIPDEMTEQSESSVTEVGGEDVVDEDIPPEMLNTSPETEQTRLEGEAKSDQLTMPQGGQESKPKFYVDSEELTLPGDGGLEYRIGSPHQDFEDYKGIVDANKQYNIASAAQTSDSLGEAVGTLAAASQDGVDFTKEDEYFYGKYGRDAYIEAAYPETDDESPALSDLADTSTTSSDEINEESPDPENTEDIQDADTTQLFSDAVETAETQYVKKSDNSSFPIDTVEVAAIQPQRDGADKQRQELSEFDPDAVRNVMKDTVEDTNDIKDLESRTARKNLYERSAMGSLTENLCYKATGAQNLNEISDNFRWADGTTPNELQQVKSHVNMSVEGAMSAYTIDFSKTLGAHKDSTIDQAVDKMWELRSSDQWKKIYENIPPEVANAVDKESMKKAMLDKVVLRIPSEDVPRFQKHVRMQVINNPEKFGLKNPSDEEINKLVGRIRPATADLTNHQLRLMARDVFQQKMENAGYPRGVAFAKHT
ncbi:MAG: hypothetical protein U0Z26_11775 [Anaerolineales bacterium]